MDEFDLIKTYFAPLAKGFKGSLGLTDDAAIIRPPAGCELAVTTDAISAGVHFIGDEDPALIARKLLRVNLSDLAAMGAKPLCYFLTLMLPSSSLPSPLCGGGSGWRDWIKRFATGLREDQEQFHIHLAGGDTTSTKGTLSLSLTALGTIPTGKALKRSGAKPGDIIYVSGTLGDSALGLSSLRATAGSAAIQNIAPNWIAWASPRNDEFNLLTNRYLLPEPRVTLGQKLIGAANACMDISDGLVQDLGHICKASNVGATIHQQKLPLSKPAAALIEADKTLWEYVLGGGDDYELLFTVPPEKESRIKKLAKYLKLPLTAIGKITKGKEVQVLDEKGKLLEIEWKGYRHF